MGTHNMLLFPPKEVLGPQPYQVGDRKIPQSTFVREYLTVTNSDSGAVYMDTELLVLGVSHSGSSAHNCTCTRSM